MTRRRGTKKRLHRKKLHRKRTRRLQRGGDNSKPVVVFTLTNNAGFGSVFGFLLKAYIYAKKEGKNFLIKSDNWQFGDGWHDYFTSLDVYDPAAKYANEENYKHGSVGRIPEYSLGEYMNAVKEIYTPKPEIVNRAKAFTDKIGGPYISVYIRRGDKTSGTGKEMDAADLPKLVEEMGVSGGNVFVMSDDYSVVEEITKLLPKCKIFTMTPPENRGLVIYNIQKYDSEQKKKHADELFTSMEVFNGGEKGWVDNRSNIGRFLKIRGGDKITLYPSDMAPKNLTAETIVDPPNRSLGI